MQLISSFKTPSTPATTSKQHCRFFNVEYYKSNDYFDKVECCFDIVAFFWQQCRTKFRPFDTLKQIEYFCRNRLQYLKQHSTLSKGRKFTINSLDIVAVFGNKVECCFDKVERCFDIVAGVDRA